MKNIVAILGNTGDAVDKAHAEGIHVAGERYVVTKIEDRSLYGRQVSFGRNARRKDEEEELGEKGRGAGILLLGNANQLTQGRTGVVIVKTKQAVLIGYYGEGIQAGNAAQTVETLADYLINVGY